MSSGADAVGQDVNAATPHGGRGPVVACVAVQCLGYLLLWFGLHAQTGLTTAPVASATLVSAGWYDPGSAYAARFAKLPLLGTAVDAPLLRRWVLATAFAVATAGYAAGLWLVRRGSIRLTAAGLALATVVIAAPLLAAPQLLSGDLWSYVIYGRVAVIDHGNPLVDPPSAYPGDPFLGRVDWKATPSVYGPAWTDVAVLLTHVAQWLGGSAVAYAVTFRGFIFAAHLVNAALVRRILRAIRPARATWGALLYAWNPLCLVEFAGNGHNDGFMLTLVLAGIAFAAAGRTTTPVGWLVAAGLTKLTGGLGVPAYSLWVARRQPSARPAILMVARHLAVALLIAAALYAPFWRGAQTFHATTHAANLQLMYRSPGSDLARGIVGCLSSQTWQRHLGPWRSVGRMTNYVRFAVRQGCLLGFLFCLAVLTLRRVRDFDGWLDRLTWIYVAYLLLAAYQFHPWYGTWLVPLTALLPDPPLLLVVAPVAFLIDYLPLPITDYSIPYFWPLLLLVVLRTPRFLRWARTARLGQGLRQVHRSD